MTRCRRCQERRCETCGTPFRRLDPRQELAEAFNEGAEAIDNLGRAVAEGKAFDR